MKTHEKMMILLLMILALIGILTVLALVETKIGQSRWPIRRSRPLVAAIAGRWTLPARSVKIRGLSECEAAASVAARHNQSLTSQTNSILI